MSAAFPLCLPMFSSSYGGQYFDMSSITLSKPAADMSEMPWAGCFMLDIPDKVHVVFNFFG